MIELEKTYLAKKLPTDLASCHSKEMLDIYFPKDAVHASIRLRKIGDRLELTKKVPLKEDDFSEFKEHTIPLTKEEYEAFATLPGKRLHKQRYYYPYQEGTLEIDVFLDDLQGLVLVDMEFISTDAKSEFAMPDFCLADVTQDDFIAGGMLCGKKYEDIALKLENYTYKKLILE